MSGYWTGCYSSAVNIFHGVLCGYGSFPASFLGRSSYTDSDFTVAKMAPASGGQGLKIKKIRNYE